MLSPHEDEDAADQTENGPDCDLPDELQDSLAEWGAYQLILGSRKPWA